MFALATLKGRVTLGVLGPAAVAAVVLTTTTAASTQETLQLRATCDAVLTALFAPRHPVLGRYEVCADPRPLSSLASVDWTVEAVGPLEAFGLAGGYDRARLARLFGGGRARVVRRWNRTPNGFESWTLISPHPDRTLTRLEPGTLVIRWVCDARDAACQISDAR